METWRVAILPRLRSSAVARDGFLTRAEVAEMLRVPAATLAAWAYRGDGPAYYAIGRHCRYRLADIEAWLKGRRHSADGVAFDQRQGTTSGLPRPGNREAAP